MAHMALYRKWRPMTFEDVVEQGHIVTTLKNSIKSNTVSHAYLFCGTRGTGKTTLAKIFARAINCEYSEDGSPCNKCTICKGILDGSIIDVIEIDAASNNGVDDVREIKEAVMYVPAITRYKVYIIDEVHMLSTGAFNALLKTLEEPPKNVVFILATTEPHKLPSTILSRCQRFDFKRITLDGLEERLRIIANDCDVEVERDALKLIARLSGGGMRDAISLLDQCITQGKAGITHGDVAQIAGLTATEAVNTFARAIIDKNAPVALNAIKDALDEGRDLIPLCNQLIDWFRNLMLFKTGGAALDLIDLTDEEIQPVEEAANLITFERTLDIIKELSEIEGRLKWADNPRIIMEVSSVKLCSTIPVETGLKTDSLEVFSELEDKLRQMEERVANLEQGIRIEPEASSKKTPALPKSPNTKKTVKESKVNRNERGDYTGEDNKYLDRWPDIIECVRSMNKMKVYAYLLETRCFISEDGIANIVVSGEDALKKTVLSRSESLDVIKEAIQKVLGIGAKIKIVDEKALNTLEHVEEDDPILERVKQFATENGIPLNIED